MTKPQSSELTPEAEEHLRLLRASSADDIGRSHHWQVLVLELQEELSEDASAYLRDLRIENLDA